MNRFMKPLYCLTAIVVLQFFGGCTKDKEPEPAVPIDGDGNIYNTIKVGSQEWLLENLKTTKLNDGTLIPLVSDPWEWDGLTTPARCWYNNDGDSNKDVYGGLYNWYAINTKKLCPKGWHIPTEDEWNWLFSNFGGTGNAGGKLKESGTMHWNSPNTGADNSYGFTALPGGIRIAIGNSTYAQMGTTAHFWIDNPYAHNIEIYYNRTSIGLNGYNPDFGLSVRCIKDK
jgi:uncharacterized protein (TIGR02145 family)